ncbi:MAG: hypothetical protein PHR28_08020 [candidate division Zixibacteria bacterium]|nr:hypothetical protein [candidate division Zixibacteria bacterium]
MKDIKVLKIRIFVAIATFIALSLIFVDMVSNKVRESASGWYPNPIEIVLFVISFITLAIGVSYLSEIFSTEKKYSKILLGILSLIVFVIIFFPQKQDSNPIIGWLAFLGLSSSSILISVFSTLEWARRKIKLRWMFSFLFALSSGIYAWLIFAMILRGYNFSKGGLLLVGYGAILFLINMIGNLLAISSLKNMDRGKK